MYRKILALLLVGTMLCTTEVSVLAEDDQIFDFETEDERVWDNSDPFVYESEISDAFLEEELESETETDSSLEEEIELETEETLEADSEWETDYEINPIYLGVMDEADLQEPESGDEGLFYAEAASYCTTDAEAIAIVKDAMLHRADKVNIYYKSAVPYNRSMVTGWTAGARAHTGVPGEGDYLHLHYGGASWSKLDEIGDDGCHYVTIKLKLTYYTSAEQEAAVTEKISGILHGFAFTAETTDIEKFDKIYSWICQNVSYDYNDAAENKLRYSAYGALFNHTAVCQGYAALLYRMLLEAGVPARVITGKSGSTNHAWNIVQIGDAYYNADVTWDAQKISNQSTELLDMHTFRYRLKSNENFINHTRGADYDTAAFHAAYPMAAADYSDSLMVSAAAFNQAKVSGVSLNQTKVSVRRTESVSLAATVLPKEAEHQEVSWKVSNTAVSVDDHGRVTGNIPGEATVTVTTKEGGFTAGCVVTVKPKDDIEAFVTRFYNVILDRRPDPTGLNYWTNLLRSNKKTGESVAHGFIFSNEFKKKQMSDADYVEYLYKSILDRGSDKNGKAYWCNLLKKSGYTREKVFKGFIDSNEFGRLCSQYGIRRR